MHAKEAEIQADIFSWAAFEISEGEDKKERLLK